MWSIEFLDENVFDEMQSQPNDIKAKLEHVVKLIQANGLEHIHESYIKHLEGELWEKGYDCMGNLCDRS